MNPLLELIDHGQSCWLDNLTRDMLRNGDLERRVRDEGLRGVTSNPSIFHDAITQGSAYDEQIAELADAGLGVGRIYERIVIDDIRSACDVLRPVYDESGGGDGFVSLEVSPYLVHDTGATIDEARRLFAEVDRPNVLIKIPGSPAGTPAIEQMIAEGVNVNVTLLFSIDAYEAVAHAYLNGLERRVAESKPVDGVASVASFFLSRIDVLVDRLLGQRIRPRVVDSTDPRPEQLLGRAAVANAKLAYRSFRKLFSGERWNRLAERGARVQRVLWASTSTKNPLYSDVRYVEPLIGPDTVNTMPDATMEAFADHGVVRPATVEEGIEEAARTLERLDRVGIDLDRVTWQLLNEGMSKFTGPYDRLMSTLQDRRTAALGAAADAASARRLKVDDALDALDERRFAERLHAHDATLWSLDGEVADAIANRLGWLDAVDGFAARIDELEELAAEVRADGTDRIVVLGMGGSSLCPEMSAEVFGPVDGWPRLTVLDSTDPDAVSAVERDADPERTLYVVASKSGTTAETMSFFRHFWSRARDRLGDDAGGRFVAITDPDSPLEEAAREHDFRRVFLNPKDIGGRYSALSYFGLVPMALMGVDVGRILERARVQLTSSGPELSPRDNSGVRLGTQLGIAARGGRDKVTLLTDDAIAPFGWWLEQLLAESTGKQGTGLLPVEGEPIGGRDDYGDDRLFVSLSVGDRADDAVAGLVDELDDSGHSIVRIRLDDLHDLGAEFVRWEVATATAGAILGINPFDEPNVAESKRNTRRLLSAWESTGRLDEGEAAVSADGLTVWVAGGVEPGDSPVETVRSLLGRLQPGGYLALLPYFRRTERRHAALQALRGAVRSRHRVATTLGYGPRYLHSTGQLHKGGPATGSFIVFTADRAPDDEIPGEKYGFSTLIRAQAVGDFQALGEHGRPVLRVNLGGALDERLESLVDELR